MITTIDQKRQYIGSLDLSGIPRGIIHQDAAAEAGSVFDQAKDQAQVIGSGAFSYGKGLDAATRESIADSLLLAQLVANKSVSFEQSPKQWFDKYSEVLQNLGWQFIDRGWSDYRSIGTAAEVNEHIVEVLSLALGPAPAALAIITATVSALKKMQPGSSWFTIFSRDARKANIARFHLGGAEPNPDDANVVQLSLLGCLLEAQSEITQVLFFKYRDAHASFEVKGAEASLNGRALVELGPDMRSKVRAYQRDYLSSIQDIAPVTSGR